ncbi:MAG: GntR family transcriptional regulator [Polaromonas sp.]|nr:GntR family transcriptional regulator [Polaromonas sp.]
MNAPTPVVRVAAPLRQQVSGMLRAAIANGHFLPGQRLVERELCASLEISRPLLREALRQLEAEGLIRPVPPRGLEVSRISVEDARNIYAIRLALEGVAVAGFVNFAPEAQRLELDAAVKAVENAARDQDRAQVHASKNRFYEIILGNCGNPLLSEFLSLLHNRIQLLRGTSLSEPNRLPNTVKEIQAIHRAIRNNDAALAQQVCNEHIENAGHVTVQALERQEETKVLVPTSFLTQVPTLD